MLVRRSRLAKRTGVKKTASDRRRSTKNKSHRLENLEERMLLAVGPQLVGIQPNAGDLLIDGDVRNVAPQELSFRFDDDQVIDPATLEGIRITRSGFDGTFERAAALTDFNTNGAVVAEFSAVPAGIAGERITVDVIKADLGLITPPAVDVAGTTVTFTLNTNATSPSTVNDLVAALANSPAANRLIRLDILEGNGATNIAAPAINYAPLELHGHNSAQALFDFDTGGAVQIELTAVQEGVDQNGSQIRFTKSNRGTTAGPGVFVQNGVVNVDLNQNAANTTTAQQVVDAINNNLLASQLVEARLVVGTAGADVTTPLQATLVSPAVVTLDGANDLVITPGFIGVQPAPDQNEVIVRFAEALPDDLYRIEVFGFDDAELNVTAVRNAMGNALMPEAGEFESLEFELELGAQVVGVVPQPVIRSGGTLVHQRNLIEVYFNNDDLFPQAISTGDLPTDPSVVDPQFYQLIFTGDTVNNNDDLLFTPESISYDPATNRAELTFASDLEDLIPASLGGEATYRLRIGNNELSPSRPAPNAPVNVDLTTQASSDFNSGGVVNVSFAATDDFAEAVQVNVTKANLGPTAGPRIQVIDNVISAVLNTNALSLTTANDLVSAINNHSAASQLVDASLTGSGAANIAVSAMPSTSITLDGFGSSFDTASDLNVLTDQSLIISSHIDPQRSGVGRPNDLDTPGHSDLPQETVDAFEQHVNPLFATANFAGATSINYNFRSDYGVDPNGNPLSNAIRIEQRERAREALELWGAHLGIQFVETPDSGITFATGDLRVLDETADNVFKNGNNYEVRVDPTFNNSLVVLNVNSTFTNDFGGSYFNNLVSAVGFVLGLGRADDLPSSTVMALQGLPEPIYPGDHDIAHGLQIHDADSNDIDLYRFEVDFDDPQQTGQFTAEIFAERQHQASDLDTVITLYREVMVTTDTGMVRDWELMARNDDYFSEDSYLQLDLTDGVYYIGVSASGNDVYDPTIEDTGEGGRTDGKYDLRIDFRPQVDSTSTITDADGADQGLIGTPLDGDADGSPGGAFNFWFQTRSEDRTVYIDKSFNTLSTQPRGTLANPYNQIDVALAATAANERVDRGDIIRIVANGGADDDLSTVDDNQAYEIGFGTLNGQILSDGSTFNVPQEVTVMVDPGAIFKLRRARIGVGSSTLGVNRANGALQVLGTPENQVIFTSYNDQSIGVDTNPSNTTPSRGDWGGLSFRRNVDDAEGRFHFEEEGIFLNYVNQADIRWGGGSNVFVDSNQQTINPIHIVDTRPTVTFNRISDSADSAMSAAPNSFEETNFHSFQYQVNGPFTSDYSRVGPDIHGNTLRNNSTNGLFIRVETPVGGTIRELTVPGRFDDIDIVHVIAQNLPIDSTPGGAILETVQPSVNLVTVNPQAGGTLAQGDYNYKVTFVDANGFEGIPSDATITGTVAAGQGTLRLANLPPVTGDFVARRIYRSAEGGTGPYTLVAGLNRSSTTFVDNGETAGGSLRFDPVSAADVTVNPTAGGTLQPGTYNYVMTFVDENGKVSAPSGPTASATISGTLAAGGTQAIQLDNLPDPFNAEPIRRIYRSTGVADAPYELVAELNSAITSFTDSGTSLGEELPATAFGVLRPRLDASLVVDPSTVVKLEGSRIDVAFGSQVLAEGFEGQEVIFTSRLDDRYGAGGTFDTNNDDNQTGGEATPSPGDWAGFYIGYTSSASIENAYIGFGGGDSTIEGTFKAFNVIEVLSADFRLAHSTIESNANGQGGQGPGDRFGRTANGAATIYVRDAQPVIIDNIFRDNTNGAAIININANSLNADVVGDLGRSTGPINRVAGHDNNQGPLVSDNRLENNSLNGMLIRGGTLTTESVWDDTDMVHLLFSNIIVGNFHQSGGLRLESQPDESLVVKLRGQGANFDRDQGAGFLINGATSNVEDRVGGIFHLIGQPGFPVVLTSLADDTIGAGLQPDGSPQVDTNNNGSANVPQPNDWRGVRIDRYAHDRNVQWVLERELPGATAPGDNASVTTAQNLGDLAPNEKSGDDNLRLGWDINGFLNEPNDVDIYSFEALAGTELFIDIDDTLRTVDTVIELMNADGDVIARSDNSLDESRDPSQLFNVENDIASSNVGTLDNGALGDHDFFSTNQRDAGFRVLLPGAVGTQSTFFFSVSSADGKTSGVYELQIRMRAEDDFAGSTVQFADVRYAQNAIEVFGHPAHSPLTGEAAENENVGGPETNDNFVGTPDIPADGPQPIGNILTQDRGVLSLAGTISGAADVDFFQFQVNYPSLSTAINSQLHAALTFDVDYADGIDRPNTSLWIFDAQGRLVLAGRDSNVADDRPRIPSSDPDYFSDLSHGSFGPQDPFIGSVVMPTGTYYAVMTSNGRMPTELTNNPLVRLEPVNSVRRIAEDHIGTDGSGGSTAEPPVVPVLLDNTSISADPTNLWHISDREAGTPGHGLNPTFDGSRSASLVTNLPLGEVEPNNTPLTAQVIDNGPWNTSFNPNIGTQLNNNSTTVPHITIEGTGDGSFDYYSFNVAAAGSFGYFDVDFGVGPGQGSTDLALFLLDAAGNVIASNDTATNARFGAGGSTSTQDPYFSFQFAAAGQYTLAVGEQGSSVVAGALVNDPLERGDTYTLQVSLENHPTATGGGGATGGGQSFYFGSEVTGDYNTNPGGSQGSLVTNPFDLTGYSAEDLPVLYFNYLLDVANSDQAFSNIDAFRVYAVLNSGEEHLLATNNGQVGPNTGDDEFDDPNLADSIDVDVQELIDGGPWRQARVGLDDFAGESNLRLRFEFQTGDGNNNTGEGVYLDDLIIGFAERGEMVTGAGINANFGANPDSNNEILTGEYQLEIRGSTDYAVSTRGTPSRLLTHTFDTNDRLAEQLSLIAPSGAELTDGQVITISDGGNTVTFEFDNNAVIAEGNTRILFNAADSADVIARRIRDAINNPALLNLNLQAATGDGLITGSGSTSDRVSLFGNASIELESIQGRLAAGSTEGSDNLFDFENNLDSEISRIELTLPGNANVNSLPRISSSSDSTGADITVVGSNRVEIEFDNFFADDRFAFGFDVGPDDLVGDLLVGTTVEITLADGTTLTGQFIDGAAGVAGVLDLGGNVIPVRSEAHGDLNLFRDQGQIIIDSNRILDAKDFGIVSDAGDRNAETPGDSILFGAPHISPARNLHIPNELEVGGLVPGVTVKNNEISGEGLGGIHFSGDLRPFEMTTLRPADYPSQITPFLTAGDNICDGEQFLVTAYRTTVRFEFEDISGDITPGCGSFRVGGDGWSQGAIPVYYRRTSPAVYLGRSLGYSQTEMANAIRDSIQGSILVTNDTTLTIDAIADNSRYVAGPTGLADPAVHIRGASSVVNVPGSFVATIRQTPIAESPQPFGRIINNTIYGHDGNESSFSGRAPGTPDEPNDRIETAIDTKQGRAHFPEVYTQTATLGDSAALRFDNTLDVDFYKVQLSVGERLTADIDAGALSTLDSVVRLFNSRGEEVARSDNTAAPGEVASLDAYIDFTATEKDSYYIAVSGAGNTEYDPISLGNRTGPASTGDYTITANVLAPHNWVMTSLDATQIPDGTTFTISQIQDITPGVNTVTFEFDVSITGGNGFTAGNVPIRLNNTPPGVGPPAGSRGPGDRPPEVAVAIMDAINGAGLTALTGLQGPTGVIATALGGSRGAEGPLPLRTPDNADYLPPVQPIPNFGHDYIYTAINATTELYIVIEGAAKIEFTNNSLPLDPMLNGTNTDQLLPETGIYLSDRSSPTLVNNILSNNQTGILQTLSPGTVVGASVYQHNLVGSTVGANNGDFNITLGDYEPLFVNASNRDFTPAEFSRAIDSAVDSIPERQFFEQFKTPLGISEAPLQAPERDVNGLFRADDPAVSTPQGQGDQVFKDRGALDRADFVGPGAIIVNPRDNDSLGLDINDQQTIIELTEGSLSNFAFQLVDGFESSDPFPGTGVDPTTVTAEAVTVFENGRLLTDGIDYTTSFSPSTSLLLVQPVAGVWRRDKIYEVKLNNTDRFVIDLPPIANVTDSDRFAITDNNGDTATFEFDRGFVIDVPETLRLQIPAAANRPGGITDGQRFTLIDPAGNPTTFEFDSNGTPANPQVLAGNLPIFIRDAFSPQLVAEATVNAIAASDPTLNPKSLTGGAVHVGVPDGYQLDLTFAPALSLPASTLALQVPTGGAGLGGVADGQTFSITDPEGTTTTFEFETGGGVVGNNVPVTIAALATQAEIATAIVTAVDGEITLDVTPLDLGNGLVHLDLAEGSTLNIGANLFRVGVSRLVRDGETLVADTGAGPVVFEFDNNANAAGDFTIAFSSGDTQEELADKIAAAFRLANLGNLGGAQHLGDGLVQIGGIDGELLNVSGVMGSVAGGIFPGLNLTGTPGVTPSLSIQVPVDGGMLPDAVSDGETFTIANGTTSVTFEFNLVNDFNVGAGNVPISFTMTSSQAEVAGNIAGAIRSSGLGLNAFVEPGGIVNLASTIRHTLDVGGAPSLTAFGVAGGAVPVSIPADPTFNSEDLRAQVIAAINSGPLSDVSATVRGGSTIFVDGAVTISDGIDNFFLQAIADLAGNPLRANQPNDETAFTIVTPPTPLPPGAVVDYGDAPDGIGGFNYPTLQSSNGAVHLITTDAIFLGSGVDAEVDGQPTLAADGDDTLNIIAGIDLIDSTLTQPDRSILLEVPSAGGGAGGVADQESFTISVDGVDTIFEFDNNDNVSGNAVVAFDATSTAADIAEAIAEAINLELPELGASVVGDAVRIEIAAAQSVDTLNTSVVQRPLQPIQIEVPVTGGAEINEADTFTISTPAAVITFEFTTDGTFGIGNTPVLFSANDTRDEVAQSIVEAILSTNLGLVPAAIGSGLIVIDGDDEDGVSFRGALNSNSITEITVTASAVGQLDAWIDYNQDGDWNDPGEKIINNVELSAGSNTLLIRAPASALAGDTYARFRFSAAGNLLPTGLAQTGEVEDYLVSVVDGFPPTAVDDTNYTTDENTVLTVDGVTDPSILDNDFDPDGQTLIVGEFQTTSRLGAAVSVNSDGTFTYDPTGLDVFDLLDDGETVFDSFTYAAFDGTDPSANDGLFSNTATVGVTVTGINDGPVAVDDGPYQTDEDTTLNVDAATGLLANDTDIEGDSLTAIVDTLTSSLGATVTINADGSFSYDPSNSTTLQNLAPSESLDDTFSYQATDGDTTSTATATVNVTGLNDAPIVDDDMLGTITNEDTPTNVPAEILGNDNDPEGDPLTVASLGSTTTSLGATVVLNANGSFNYDPRGSATLQSLPAGGTTTDTFTYTATDGSLVSGAGTVSVTITGMNDAPVATGDLGSTTENEVLILLGSVLTSNDTDIDTGDMLSVSLVNGTSTLGASLTLDAGDISYDPTSVPVIQALRPGQQLTDTFTYRITDEGGATDTATVTITVTGENDAPTANPDAFSTNEDTLLDIDAPGILLNDTNVEGDGLTASMRQFVTSRGAMVQIFSDGRLTYDPRSADSLQALTSGESLDDVFGYTVTDDGGATSTANITVTVTGLNDAPVANDDTFDVEQGVITDILAPGVLANDTDPDGTALTVVELVSQPTLGTVTLNADGSFSYDHDDTPISQSSTDSFSYRLQDASGDTAMATVTLNIMPRMFPWQNPRNRFDVNDNGMVSISDALDIVTELRANGIRPLETDLPATIGPAIPEPYVDVNGDNLITLNDALQVVREVKRLLEEGEGEAVAAKLGVTQANVLAETGSFQSVKLSRTAEGDGVADFEAPAQTSYAVPGATLPAVTNNDDEDTDLALHDDIFAEELDLDPIVGDIASQWSEG